jgi:hypothetical protein
MGHPEPMGARKKQKQILRTIRMTMPEIMLVRVLFDCAQGRLMRGHAHSGPVGGSGLCVWWGVVGVG